MAMKTLIDVMIFGHVYEYFGGNAEKTVAWMTTENPLLGNVTPYKMMEDGRSEKLLEWVEQQLSENRPED